MSFRITVEQTLPIVNTCCQLKPKDAAPPLVQGAIAPTDTCRGRAGWTGGRWGIQPHGHTITKSGGGCYVWGILTRARTER